MLQVAYRILGNEFTQVNCTVPGFQGDMNFHVPHVDGNSHPMWPYVLVRNFHRRTQKCEFCVFSPTSVVLFETRVTLGCNLRRVFRIREYLGLDLCVHVINNEYRNKYVGTPFLLKHSTYLYVELYVRCQDLL